MEIVMSEKNILHGNAAYTLYTTSNEYANLIIEIMKPGDQNDYSLSDSMIEEMLTHQFALIPVK
jgi:hypothetical protein